MRSSVAIVAPSAVVPPVELGMGVARLVEAGFSVKVHPQVRAHELFFAGSDEVRARAFFETAIDERSDTLWCARGGYGCTRILPLLEEMTARRGIPERKLLVGMSDLTVLQNYVRARWGWDTLHAPMPGLQRFMSLPQGHFRVLCDWVRGKRVKASWERKRLRFFGRAGAAEGEIVGGNLAMLAASAGTPYFAKFRGKILFLEDVTEPLYRLDRLVRQLAHAGAFEGVRAVVLGTFTDCDDKVPFVLKSAPRKNEAKPALMPLRKSITTDAGLRAIFGWIAQRYKVPVAYGLPVGHGPFGVSALPLGARAKLRRDGRLELLEWDGWA